MPARVRDLERVARKLGFQKVWQKGGHARWRHPDGRSATVLREVLGDAVPAVWVSDLFSAQQAALAQRFQICPSQQLRDLQYAIDCGDRGFAPRMQRLLRRSQHIGRRRDLLPSATFARWRQAIETRGDRLLALNVPNAEGRKLQQRYQRHREKRFVFLDRADVPPDNNGSKRDLRNEVVHRKMTGGFRSETMPAAYAATLTAAETAKQQPWYLCIVESSRQNITI